MRDIIWFGNLFARLQYFYGARMARLNALSKSMLNCSTSDATAKRLFFTEKVVIKQLLVGRGVSLVTQCYLAN